MISYTCRRSYWDFTVDPHLFDDVSDMLVDAMIQSDFGAEDIEIHFSDITLFRNAIRAFSELAKSQGYIYQFNRENEIEIIQKGYRTRYLFMNSIPEGKDASDDSVKIAG